MKQGAVEAAALAVERHFTSCRIAILGGSAAEGTHGAYSDLDLVILDDSARSAYRRTFRENEWLVEAFVLSTEAYRAYSIRSLQEALPSLQRMIAQGIVIRDDGTAAVLRAEAEADLACGPFPWSDEEREYARYRITEYADDLLAARSRAEGIFTMQQLLGRLSEFILRTQGSWLGEGKWCSRAVRACDADLHEKLISASEEYYRTDAAKPLVALAERILAPSGGFLREGFWEEVSFGEED
ncbi:hypothetical protein J31TS4_09460 [Paenibacillus sp. J31TS4]|uniref:nucleotidyltransferase domain-containing protein n=1 Tax=Paenibacillus sp. J31TS4 TaxID=2807195 RepID=UPI001B04E02C|nr:nucleotidyltransferase domain-containing protein [Paenibacillus sp. J31TS4]GIP37666.1 hypothetical protein J31TS4_09460 [Paenibacillus sp. J31TS4]